MASNSAEYQKNDGCQQSSGRLSVLFLASEWGSSKGGLSTINRELAINIAKHPKVNVTFFVPHCNDEDKEAARLKNIKLVEARRVPGIDELQWLSTPPDDLHIDVVVGHGVKLGPQANVIRNLRKCKWVQVVHTLPEELGMHKTYANPISGAEKKHQTEVELCQLANFVVSVGPKLNEAFRCYLSSCHKGEMFFNFTPGVFTEFFKVKQACDTRRFRVLLFGRGDAEDFKLKGFDIAAKAVAALSDVSLVFVGAPEGELEKIKERFLECGIHENKLTVRSFVRNRESLKSLFCEVDLAIMPSRTEGFGLTGLEALSAGLPVLVSGNSGFGEALSEVPFGSFFVVHSEDPQIWAAVIKGVQEKDRKNRLKESEALRCSYANMYSWEEQCEKLVVKMIGLVQGLSTERQSLPLQKVSQQSESSRQRHPGTVQVLIELEGATYKTEQRADLKGLMKEMANQFFDTMADNIPTESIPMGLRCYLEGVLQVKVKDAVEGSLRITVECHNLEILEELWKDYCSGHLNEVAEKYLLTDDIKRRLHVESITLKTIILEEDYLVCKECLKDFQEHNQEPSAKERVNLLQDFTQPAGESQSESVIDSDLVTLHFSVNGKRQLPNTQRGSAQETDGEEVIFSEELVSKEDVGRSDEKFPAYLRRVKLIQDSRPTEESDNSLRVSVVCENPEILEQLWQDYRSGYLNVVAEKCLLTDDIKRMFRLTSVKLKTTILEEDYLACKDSLLNNTGSNQSVADSRQVLSAPTYQTADETRTLFVNEKAQIQSGQESSIQLMNGLFKSSKRETTTQTLQNAQASVADEENNAVDDTSFQSVEGETSTMTSDRAKTKPAEDTVVLSDADNVTKIVGETPLRKYISTEAVEESQTQSVDGQRTQAIDETHSPSDEEQNTQDVGKIPKQSAQGQHAQGQMGQVTKGNRLKPFEEGTKVLKESHGKLVSNLVTSPWLPDVKRMGNEKWDRSVDKPIYTETICKDYTDTSVPLLLNCYHDPDDLSQALKANAQGPNWNLGCSGIDEQGVQYLCDALKINDSVTNLDLSSNFLGNLGAQYLSEALKINNAWSTLDLGGNSIGDQGIQNLSEALKVNNTVTNMNLRGNSISDLGAQYLSEALKINKRMTNLDLSVNSIFDLGAQYLSEALKVNDKVTSFDLSGNIISNLGAQHLSEALKFNNTVTNLDLSWNSIGSHGAQYLSEALKANSTMTNLDLSWNSISDLGAHYLSEALKVNNTVTDLDLSGNSIYELGAQYLSEALKVNNTVTHLNLRSNSISHLGAHYLSEAFEVNNTLTHLDLRKNSICDLGAHCLSEALKVNNTVTHLDLKSNSISNLGAKYISEALKANSTVTNLDLGGNIISNPGAQSLSEVLRVNNTVTISGLVLDSIINLADYEDDLLDGISPALHQCKAEGEHKKRIVLQKEEERCTVAPPSRVEAKTFPGKSRKRIGLNKEEERFSVASPSRVETKTISGKTRHYLEPPSIPRRTVSRSSDEDGTDAFELWVRDRKKRKRLTDSFSDEGETPIEIDELIRKRIELQKEEERIPVASPSRVEAKTISGMTRKTTTQQEKEGRIAFVPLSYVEGKPVSGKTKTTSGFLKVEKSN